MMSSVDNYVRPGVRLSGMLRLLTAIIMTELTLLVPACTWHLATRPEHCTDLYLSGRRRGEKMTTYSKQLHDDIESEGTP